jgi:uncharacterized protein
MDKMIDNESLGEIFYVDESRVHGRGLFAKVGISKGEYMGTYHGPVARNNGMHVLWTEDDDGKWHGINGKNMLRFLNHSKKPHAEFDGYDLYAIRKIPPGVEIMINYGDDY